LSFSLAGVFFLSLWFWLLCDFLGEAVVRLAGDAEGGILRRSAGWEKKFKRERNGQVGLGILIGCGEMSTPSDA
jgi:hypothetical protein